MCNKMTEAIQNLYS